ncbi:MAG: hypothetical protein FJ128_07025 [Deltaproteobacteria bacterium]|nr:hypothetical protein [Deltaproteobacteria bacterium]
MRIRPALRALLLCLLFALPAGCGQTPSLVHQYVFEYPPPPSPGAARNPQAITVKRFAAAQDFTTTDMVYRPAPLQRATYRYHRWRVEPGALVADYLARDLRHAQVFTAVFTGPETEQSRYRLEGGVEEIQEIDGPVTWQAALALVVTLLDLQEEEVTKRVVFQKRYRSEETMTAQTPQGLAEAMSRNMARLSREIISDLARAVSRRPPL